MDKYTQIGAHIHTCIHTYICGDMYAHMYIKLSFFFSLFLYYEQKKKSSFAALLLFLVPAIDSIQMDVTNILCSGKIFFYFFFIYDLYA